MEAIRADWQFCPFRRGKRFPLDKVRLSVVLEGEHGQDHSRMSQVAAVFFGAARKIPDTGTGAWWDKPWETGFLKEARPGRCWLGYEGFRGDEQSDRRFHGGADKAVCVYPGEHYGYWQRELGQREIGPGAFGENLTVSDLREDQVCVGDVLRAGEALVQVSQPRQPCWKLARRWRVKDLALQVERTGFTGYYLRVLRHGWVSAGDTVVREERPFPQWSIEECNQVMHHRKKDRAAALALSECPALSASWKDSLFARGNRVTEDSSDARTGQPA
jgi:MOSC domain-containing protein YiiM